MLKRKLHGARFPLKPAWLGDTESQAAILMMLGFDIRVESFATLEEDSQPAGIMPKKPVRPLGMVRSNAPVPFLNPFTERQTRENENRKLVTALQHAKPVIDNSSPMQQPHVQDNRKREWLSDSKQCDFRTCYLNA